MTTSTLQYVANEAGDITAVVVPIETWREVTAELETQHLLRSSVMRERLLEALNREGGTSLAEALDHIGIEEEELDG